MEQKNKKQQHNHSLLKLVNELREINNFEIELPKDNIDVILKNPQQWGEQIAESFLLSFIPKFLKAKKAGTKLAQDLKVKND